MQTLPQAIDNVTRAVRSVPATADVHDLLQEALQVIQDALKDQITP